MSQNNTDVYDASILEQQRAAHNLTKGLLMDYIEAVSYVVQNDITKSELEHLVSSRNELALSQSPTTQGQGHKRRRKSAPSAAVIAAKLETPVPLPPAAAKNWGEFPSGINACTCLCECTWLPRVNLLPPPSPRPSVAQNTSI
jgi:hypothetical protein